MKKKKHYISLLSAVSLSSTLFAVPVSAAEENFSLMNPPVVEVAQGALRGYMDGETYSFLGIPYASIPERFALPEDPEAWEGVRDAQAYGPVAPIPDQTTPGTDEMVWPHRYWLQNETECQNLNIWTQSLDPSAKKPVMVFFHGGGFANGSSIEGAAYEGANLSEYGDVVVVTVNHRLNVLGFLDLSDYGEEYQYSPVAGIADLIASLQWVQDNIEVFGGDPDNVTIFGQSGGGGKVQAILHCPSAEGLVDKAIIQSSRDSAGFRTTKEVNQAMTAKTLELLGLEADQADMLKTIPVRELVAAAEEARSLVGGNWGLAYDEDFMTEEYCDWASDIPVVVGSVFSENTYSTITFGDGRHNEWTEEETQYWLKERYGDNAEEAAAEFQKVFPDMNLADACFFDGSRTIYARNILNEKIESGAAAPVYSYLFTYEAPINGGTTAFHCVDLIYAFHNVTLPILTRATGGTDNEDALKMQDIIATSWINFAKTGNPSQEGLEWKPYTIEEPNVMRLDLESSCGVLGDERLLELATAK